MAEFSQDFSLISCLLTLANGNRIELKQIVIEFNTYEDLFSNYVTADLLIRDTANMPGTKDVTLGPIFGFETVHLSFQTPDKLIWDKVLRVIRISDRQLDKERSQFYHLHLATLPLVKGTQTRISKSYRGKLISEVADDIMTNFIGLTETVIEPTTTLQQIIIPNLTANHAMNWLCTRAISASYSGATYLFYEDRDGHKFVSLEYLIAIGRPLITMPYDEVYLFQPTNIRNSDDKKTRDVELNLRGALNYKFDTNYNILDNLSSGMYANTVMTHDNVKKEWLRYEWDYPETFQNYQHLMDYPLWSQTVGDLNDPGAKFKLHGVGVNEYPVNPPDWLQPRISQLQQFHNINLTVVVPGNTNRTVGELIGFKLPSPEPPVSNQQIYDHYHQGRYMISAVRHKIDRVSHLTTLSLTSDTAFSAYP